MKDLLHLTLEFFRVYVWVGWRVDGADDMQEKKQERLRQCQRLELHTALPVCT
jgi:hypothetical protein